MNQTNNEFWEKMREIIKEELSKIDVRKMSFDRCINNIIVILENYKTLKQFTIQVENVKFSKEEIDQAKQKELEKMMEEVFSSKEIYLESVYKKHLQTKLFLNFLESTFKEYIKETLNNEERLENENIMEIMYQIGRKRGAIVSGGRIDEAKTANIILDDFRSGKLGKITIETI